MKNIELLRLRLLNFKGIKEFDSQFIKETNIIGDNGTGKTTLVDSFNWLLFGKDSHGVTDFELKTLDENNNPIHRLSHEVEALLSIEGKEMLLKKVYSENWVRRRGAEEEVLSGHETQCFIDDVAMTVTEYTSRINHICPEGQFRLITNPLAFPSLHWQVQRDLLFKMAGHLDAQVICAGNNDLLDLIERMAGKKVDDYKKTVAARRSKCKEELERVKPKIEENKRMTPEVGDWQAFEKTIEQKKAAIKEVEEQIYSESQKVESARQQTQQYRDQVRTHQNSLAEIEAQQKQSALKDYYKSLEKHNKAKTDLSNAQDSLEAISKKKEIVLARVLEIQQTLGKLTEEWKTIKAETLTISENQLSCPTCKRLFDATDIESIRLKISEDFNKSKTERLENNISKGKALAAERTELNTQIEKYDKEMHEISVLITTLSAVTKTAPTQPEFTFKKTAEVVKIESEIERLQQIINNPTSIPDTSELIAQKTLLENELSEAVKTLSVREEVKRHKDRLAELLAEESALAQELAKEEKEEQLVKDYNSLMISTVENRIAGMFKIVKFKIFDEKLNGNIEETCTAMVNGVPFSSINDAKKISAGIDIINAISKHIGVTAPIWLDNRESVVSIPDTDSQIINLYVVKGQPLTIQ